MAAITRFPGDRTAAGRPSRSRAETTLRACGQPEAGGDQPGAGEVRAQGIEGAHGLRRERPRREDPFPGEDHGILPHRRDGDAGAPAEAAGPQEPVHRVRVHFRMGEQVEVVDEAGMAERQRAARARVHRHQAAGDRLRQVRQEGAGGAPPGAVPPLGEDDGPDGPRRGGDPVEHLRPDLGHDGGFVDQVDQGVELGGGKHRRSSQAARRPGRGEREAFPIRAVLARAKPGT
ncbi:hypothetical protein MKK64_22710 [Methylobacterium sp. E-025]|uniref:hypothetical protein n=1 Tax=Methylobacterium sp. E-025 TaxID=2836561 RepID=UPI001FB90525|nr:hypothetical protein [Methylobacterium sp. E-025]MCJ2113987.1 hypothetical protein [Methylobacterium sp. E-025]